MSALYRELKEVPLMSHAPAQNGFTLYHLGQDGQCTLKDSERGPDPTNPDRVPARLTPTECRPDLVE